MHAHAFDLFMSVLHAFYAHLFELSLNLRVVPWEIVAANLLLWLAMTPPHKP